MPSVAQDSYGQFHIRGEHNALQYRLDGITLPEGISVFGQTLDPRLASSVELIDGRAPGGIRAGDGWRRQHQAEDGPLRSGRRDFDVWRQSRRTRAQASITAAPRIFNYFVAGDYLDNRLGIESPDGSSTRFMTERAISRLRVSGGYSRFRQQHHRDSRNVARSFRDTEHGRTDAWLRPHRHQRSAGRRDLLSERRRKRNAAGNHSLRHSQLSAQRGAVRSAGIGLRPVFEPELRAGSGRRPAL